VAAFHLGVRRRVASANAGIALGLRGNPRREVVRTSYASMGATFVELWTVGGVDGIERHLRVLAPTWLRAVLGRSPGCVFVTAHLGNWDVAAHAVAREVPRLVVYAKAQHNPAVDAAANVQRAGVGMEVLLAHHGDRTAAVKALRAVKAGAPLGLLADQGPGDREGVRAVFMGVTTYCHGGPGFFARRAGVPIIPGFCLRTRAGEFAFMIGRPLAPTAADEPALVQASMDLIAAMVAAFPRQYFWQHRRFKNDLARHERAVEPWKIHGLSLFADPLQALPSALR
jgi:KDO2-lipid IV(A) lauroyltransferase